MLTCKSGVQKKKKRLRSPCLISKHAYVCAYTAYVCTYKCHGTHVCLRVGIGVHGDGDRLAIRMTHVLRYLPYDIHTHIHTYV